MRFYMVSVYYRFHDALLESLYNLMGWIFYYVTISSLLNLLISQDILHSPPSPNSRTRTSKPKRSTEHARYKKTVNSALWVQLALVVCYLPSTIVLIVLLSRGLSPSVLVAGLFTATLVFLNSSLNPIIYCWKIREVRHAVKDIVKGLFVHQANSSVMCYL